MKDEAKPRVYDMLAKTFAQEEVRTCFALLGDANMNWAERLAQAGCRMIYVRHEHCALAAAMAYARKTRDVAALPMPVHRRSCHCARRRLPE